jgi:hypothetical protein
MRTSAIQVREIAFFIDFDELLLDLLRLAIVGVLKANDRAAHKAQR